MMFPSISSVGLVRFVSVEVVVVTDSVTAEVIVVVSAVVAAPEQAQKLRTIASKSAIERFAFFIFPPLITQKEPPSQVRGRIATSSRYGDPASAVAVTVAGQSVIHTLFSISE
jgi:hypothetical protein